MNPEWKNVYGSSGPTEAYRCYRDEALGIQLETVTKRRTNGDWGKQRNFYFIDGDKREFLDEEDLIDALRARESSCVCVACGQRIRKNSNGGA